MPREPRKIDPDEMALYNARYCKVYEETESKLVVHPEDKVVKPIDKSTIHEDNWPMFVLKDTMPTGEGGNIVNILLAVRGEPYVKVTGRVIVDNDMKGRLCTFRGKQYKNLNGASIQLRKPDNIAIGFDPTTIWIASESGWFEVQPAHKYREAFDRVNHVINFFFLAVDHFEEMAKVIFLEPIVPTVRDDVEEVLFRYVNFIGSGVTILEVIDALRESKDYILDQFRKKMGSEYYVAGNKNMKWTDSNVYRWICAGLPLDMPDTLPADPVMALAKPPLLGSSAPVTFKPGSKRSATPQKKVEVSAPSIAAPPAPQQGSPGPLAPISTQTITSKKTREEEKPSVKAHHGEYISPQFPQGILADFDTVEKIVAVAFHAIHTQRRGTEKGLNMSKLRYCVYVDHAFDNSQAQFQIFHYYAKKVAARLLELDPSLKDSTLYEELSKAKSTYPASIPEKDKKRVAMYTTAKPPLVLQHRTTLGKSRNSPRPRDSSPSVPVPSIGNFSSAMDTMSIISGSERASTTNGKRVSNSPPAATKSSKKQKFDPSVVSRSREASPAPSGPAPVKLDSLGKVIPKRIKRFY